MRFQTLTLKIKQKNKVIPTDAEIKEEDKTSNLVKTKKKSEIVRTITQLSENKRIFDPSTKDKIMDSLREEINSRTVIEYNWKTIFHYFLWCIRCRSNKNRRKHQTFRNHILYSSGKRKLMKELDVVSLLISARKIKIMSSILLNKHQTLLMNFSKDNKLN